ncbi:MAG: GNAT family N-acetyltransferase [Trebonia sp.]
MTSPRFRSQRLEATHAVADFNCGNEVLDRWLHRHAATAQAKRTSVTYLWTTAEGRAGAYYSLAPHLIENADLPRRLGRGDPRQIPAILLARLALSTELHGADLGGILLHDALSRAVAASQRAGGRYVVVDAIDNDACQFYEHYGFTATPRPDRLVRKVSDIEADIKTA